MAERRNRDRNGMSVRVAAGDQETPIEQIIADSNAIHNRLHKAHVTELMTPDEDTEQIAIDWFCEHYGISEEDRELGAHMLYEERFGVTSKRLEDWRAGQAEKIRLLKEQEKRAEEQARLKEFEATLPRKKRWPKVAIRKTLGAVRWALGLDERHHHLALRERKRLEPWKPDYKKW